MSRKVLFVHDGPMGVYKGSCYGVHYSNDLVERYLYLGDQVTFLTRRENLGKTETQKHTKITHPQFKFKSFPNFKSLRSRTNKPAAMRIIRRAVKTHDVIITRLPSAGGAIAFRYAIKQNLPVLVEFVACVFDALWNYDWRGKLLAHYKYHQYRKLMQQATHTIYVTDQFLQSRYPTTNGKSVGCSDVEILDQNEKVLHSRLERWKSGMPTPLTLATIAAVDVRYKGHCDVFRALALLKKEGHQFRYKIVGQGNPGRLISVAEDLEVEKEVELTGPIPHQRIFSFLEKVDVYLQPSYVEGLPRTVIEAMSVGCPVVGSRVGGIPELIKRDFTYEPKNEIDLANKLGGLRREDLSREATNNFYKAKNYSFSHLNEKRKSFYSEFLYDYTLSNR